MHSRFLKSLILFALFSPTLIFAQTTAALIVPNVSAERIARLEAQVAQTQSQVAQAQSSADNAWMLVCAALVLLMTGPGLALFYGGLVRRKNVLSHPYAELRHDGHGHDSLGHPRLLPRFRSGTAFIGGLTTCFSAPSDSHPTLTTPPQSRSRPSWFIS